VSLGYHILRGVPPVLLRSFSFSVGRRLSVLVVVRFRQPVRFWSKRTTVARVVVLGYSVARFSVPPRGQAVGLFVVVFVVVCSIEGNYLRNC